MKDFKPAFRFLGIFVGIYLVLNVLYGIWISSYGTHADPITRIITEQTSFLLNILGEESSTQPKATSPAVSIKNGSGIVLSVFEGCNGLNVMIVFVSFLFAFGGERKSMMWFLPTGLLLVYVANLFRVGMLYFIALYRNQYFYYAHKYVLTAFLYLIVFTLWWWWIERVSGMSLRKLVNK
jgi:exosortase family protein XrtF